MKARRRTIPHRIPQWARTGALACVLGGSLGAQGIQTLILEGDPVPGAPGTLSSVLDVSVNDDGEWLIRTTVSSAGSTLEVAILNGAAVLIQDDDLFDPPGLTVDRFDDVEIGNDGALWWNIDTSASGTLDEIMYRNLTLLGREGSDVGDPGQSNGTIWKDFDGFDVGPEGNLLVLGDIDNPTVSGPTEAMAGRMLFDELGALLSVEVLLREGNGIPGTFDAVLDVGTNAGAHDVGIAGDHWIVYVRGDGGSGSDEILVVDGLLAAKEGQTGPDVGTIWSKLSSNAVDIVDTGDYVFRGEYSIIGGDTLSAIFKNGEVLFQEGDTSDSLAPWSLASFGQNTPILLGENGNVVYYGKTDNTNTSIDDAYFLNDRYLVQGNTTPVGGNVIGNLITGPNGISMSKSGRYVVFEAFFADGTNGAFLMDLGLIQEMESCSTALGTLEHVGGIPILGETVEFQMDGEQDLGVTPVFLLSTDPIVGWPPCGLMTPFGELLIDVSSANGNPAVIQFGMPSDFSPADFSVLVPADPNLLGRQYYAQGLWWDIGDQTPAENFRFTNALQIDLGPN